MPTPKYPTPDFTGGVPLVEKLRELNSERQPYQHPMRCMPLSESDVLRGRVSELERIVSELSPRAVSSGPGYADRSLGESVGAQVRRIREVAGKSCRTLAREVGISASYLSDLETGKRGAPPAMLKRLAAVLGVPVEAWLLAWAEANVDGEVLAAVRGQV